MNDEIVIFLIVFHNIVAVADLSYTILLLVAYILCYSSH